MIRHLDADWVVADHDYAATTVATVASTARVSLRTFYEHFTDKEDCFVAACWHGTGLLFAAIPGLLDDVMAFVATVVGSPGAAS